MPVLNGPVISGKIITFFWTGIDEHSENRDNQVFNIHSSFQTSIIQPLFPLTSSWQRQRRDKQPFTLTFTPQDNLNQLIPSLQTVGGSHLGRAYVHRENMHTAHRKALAPSETYFLSFVLKAKINVNFLNSLANTWENTSRAWEHSSRWIMKVRRDRQTIPGDSYRELGEPKQILM